MVTARDQVEATDAEIGDAGPSERVSDAERVVVVQLVVKARADSQPALWRDIEGGVGIRRKRRGVQDNCIDDGSIVDGLAFQIECERGALTEGPGDGVSRFVQQERAALFGPRTDCGS